jgi:DNA-directed RNA polymerase I subunit RPA2
VCARQSNRCSLRSLSSKELVAANEEPHELGGYFIINGNERLVRFLIVPRANHVTAIERPSFANRGPSYTNKGCSIRCVHRDDLMSVTNTVHYLDNGGVTLRFSMRKQEYMIPVVMLLKALVSATDKEIFSELMQGDFGNTFLADRVELLLRGFKTYSLWTGEQCLQYLGDKFRVAMAVPDDWTDYQVGAELIERILLVHLDTPREKFKLLTFMMRKLYSLVAGDCCVDNPDSPQHQEILLPGFLYGQIIKERLDEYAIALRGQIARDVRTKARGIDFFDGRYISKTFSKVVPNIGGRLSSFLATGNLSSPSGLDLQQTSGFTIVAEKLNFYRYISHFRCVHRGAFFAELKTTTVRKLLPEAWGFLCPVHTPDGSPCGLLNHFSHSCRLITRTIDASHVPGLLTSLGMSTSWASQVDGRSHVVVQLDGATVGYATPSLARHMATVLRLWKTEGLNDVPLDLEIGFVPTSKGGQYPGLYLFSGRSRMMRPVRHLANNRLDMVGPFEQVYLDVACLPDEIEKGLSTHAELSPTNVLSVIANLTPFSDYNQSPRNM